MGEGPCPTVGVPYHLSTLAAIPPTIHNPIGAVLPDEPEGLGGDTEGPVKYCLPVDTS